MSEEPNPLVVFATIATIISGVVAIYFIQQKRKSLPVLDAKEFRQFPLIDKTKVSHNSAIYKFGLPKVKDQLGLPIGKHISVAATIEGKEVVRSYTPVSAHDQEGYFELLVKVYEKGNISKHIDLKNIGETVDVRGPKGFFDYTPNMVKKFGMIAGGSGITPMYQILKAILTNKQDQTQVDLIYANVSEDDILMKEELDTLSKENPNRFKVHYVLNNPPSNWQGSVGFVTPEIMKNHLPSADEDSTVLICGPPPMVSAMKKGAQDIGYPKAKPVSKSGDRVFVF